MIIVLLTMVMCCLVHCGCTDQTMSPELGATVAKPQAAYAPRRALALAPPAVEVIDDTPQSAARSFLGAIQAGDATVASELLVAEAKRALNHHGLRLRVLPSATAEFHVGRVDYLDQNNDPNEKSGAYVECHWSGGTANESVQKFLLVEKQEPEGWRLAGVAFLDSSAAPYQIINFAAPEELALSGPNTVTP